MFYFHVTTQLVGAQYQYNYRNGFFLCRKDAAHFFFNDFVRIVGLELVGFDGPSDIDRPVLVVDEAIVLIAVKTAF